MPSECARAVSASLLCAHLPKLALVLLTLAVAACTDIQSVMAPQSLEAERTKRLADLLFIGGAAILLLIVGLCVASVIGTPAIRARLAHDTTVLIGGAVFPAVTLTALLVYSLAVMRDSTPAATNPIAIDVQGERWWWRVTYLDPQAGTIASANEIRVPVNQPVRLRLTTADVIHSFWVPRLAGKVDMIPGRVNLLRFTVTAAGAFRGQCAEYCGGSHALMGMRVIAVAPEDFRAWLAHEQRPAREPSSPIEQQGRDLFLERGCGACHTIRGIAAVGKMGPDLTHVGARQAIAAETLPMTTENLAHWIAHNDHVKPSNLMPSYGAVPEQELHAIASYLFSLK
jgi:cytochrome c oxidase subunit 2